MSANFLLDENIPYALIDLLERKGFSVGHLKKMGKIGIKNGEVYELAEKTQAWILTRDTDFQNIRRFMSHNISGIILLKLTRTNTDYLLDTMRKLLDKHRNRLSEKHLIIVEDEEVKIY